MANKHGSLSIDSDNLFPIIKKWLYSDHDIFYRELISNGCDAITKLKKLDMMGEYSLPADYKAKIQVIVNPEEKTFSFILFFRMSPQKLIGMIVLSVAKIHYCADIFRRTFFHRRHLPFLLFLL